MVGTVFLTIFLILSKQSEQPKGWSVTFALRLPSQPQIITVVWPVPNCNCSLLTIFISRYKTALFWCLDETEPTNEVNGDKLLHWVRIRDGNWSGRPAPVAGRVGSTLGDRCVTGRPHKMQSGTRRQELIRR